MVGQAAAGLVALVRSSWLVDSIEGDPLGRLNV